MKYVNHYVEELFDFTAGLISDNQNDNYELVERIDAGDANNNKENFEYDVRHLEFRTDLASRLNKMLGEFMDAYFKNSKK